jgi:dienelactone hydrolase
MIYGVLLLLLLVKASVGLPSDLRHDPLSCFEQQGFTTGTYLEEQVRIPIDRGTLAGRLFTPNSEGPHPAVLILPGGGRSPRLQHTSRFMAARLARCGVAALFYDKRGTGKSEGSWEQATYDDLIDDADAALRLLAVHPIVDPTRIGLVGLSQGGRLAPVVAARNGTVAYVVSASAPFVSLRETRLFALDQFARQHGYAERWHTALLSIWNEYLDYIEARTPTASLDHRIERLSVYIPARLLPPLSHQDTGEPLFNSLSRDYLATLGELRVPMLALYGDQDQVIPVAASLEQLRASLNPGVALEVLLVPGVDHAFAYVASSLPRFRFEDVITRWVLQQVGQPGECLSPEPQPTTARPALDTAMIGSWHPCPGATLPNATAPGG